MSSRITRKTTRRELAAIVARALAAAEIDAVLVGGAVAALYSKGRYLTDDLDFVSYKPLKLIAPVMQRLGFKMVGNKATHHAADLYVQFCAPPVTVGHAPVTPVRLKTRLGTLELLSPTDCVLDRLMKYYHWDDEQGLEQALLVARSNKIDLTRVREVSRREGQVEKLKVFEKRL